MPETAPPVRESSPAAMPKKAVIHKGGAFILGTGRAWLVANEVEDPEYGLQSYFLLAHPPLDLAEKHAVLTLFDIFITGLKDVGEMAPHFAKEELNVTWLPVLVGSDSLNRAVGNAVPSAWADSAGAPDLVRARTLAEVALEHYDYPRAQKLLAWTRRTLVEGPYVLSFEHPLQGPIEGKNKPSYAMIAPAGFSEDELKEVFTRYLEVSYDPTKWRRKDSHSFFSALNAVLATIGLGAQKVATAVRFVSG